jgi:hypothetical protein
MKIRRSWPAKIPEGRTGYVVDALPRFEVDNYDVRGLAELDDDVLLLEWDIAIGKDQLRAFVDRVKQEPARVLVAPYRVYHEGGSGRLFNPPKLIHRRFLPGVATPGTWLQIREDNAREVQEGESCHLFGLGMVYLPKWLLHGFRDDYLQRNPLAALNDELISEWHFHHAEDPEVPITWDIWPVHLHYSTKGLVDGGP